MSSKIVTVEEAETRLLELIDLAERGEDIVISHKDQPKVKLVPIGQNPRKRIFGQTGVKSGWVLTLMIPCRMTSGSAGRHEAAT